MKKSIILIILSCLLISLCGCFSVPSTTVPDSANNSDTTTAQNNALVTNTPETVKCDWEIGEFTDEFDKPTGKKYMINYVSNGKFSNSATTNSRLSAALQITSDSIAFMLWEYGSQLVKGIFDYEDYEITVLDDTGNKHYYNGTIYDGGTRIYLDNSDMSDFLKVLRSSKTVSIYLKTSKYSTSTYLFEINNEGFTNVYKSIK